MLSVPSARFTLGLQCRAEPFKLLHLGMINFCPHRIASGCSPCWKSHISALRAKCFNKCIQESHGSPGHNLVNRFVSAHTSRTETEMAFHPCLQTMFCISRLTRDLLLFFFLFFFIFFFFRGYRHLLGDIGSKAINRGFGGQCYARNLPFVGWLAAHLVTVLSF